MKNAVKEAIPLNDATPIWARLSILIGAVVFFVAAWAFLTANIPWEDDFDAILGFLSWPPCERWRHLLDLHNEHRILTTRLIVEAVVQFCGKMDFRICMLVGNLFMLILATIWFRMFRKLGYEWIGLAFFVLNLSLVHWANQLNALCANQNILAVLLPFTALILTQKRGGATFTLGMIMAILATFTSGSGVFVWPALFVTELIGLRNRKRLVIIVLLAIVIVGMYFALPNDRAPQIVKDVAQQGETVITKTTIMGYTVEITPMFLLRHIAYASTYFFACVGGVVILPWFNVFLGCVLFAIAIWLAFSFRHIKSPAIFGLLIYLLCCCASCGVFRASSFNASVPSRYQVVCQSIIAAIFYLALERFPQNHLSIRFGKMFCILTCLASLSYFIYAAPILHNRARLHRRNILMWPKSDMGLRYLPDERKPHASNILKTSFEKGIYCPEDVMKPGEEPPITPAPDVMPLF